MATRRAPTYEVTELQAEEARESLRAFFDRQAAAGRVPEVSFMKTHNQRGEFVRVFGVDASDVRGDDNRIVGLTNDFRRCLNIAFGPGRGQYTPEDGIWLDYEWSGSRIFVQAVMERVLGADAHFFVNEVW